MRAAHPMRACAHPERDHIHIQMAIYDQLLTRLHTKDDEVEHQAHVVALRPISRSCIERIAKDRDRFWEAAPGFGVSKRRNVQFCVGEGKQEHMSRRTPHTDHQDDQHGSTYDYGCERVKLGHLLS